MSLKNLKLSLKQELSDEIFKISSLNIKLDSKFTDILKIGIKNFLIKYKDDNTLLKKLQYKSCIHSLNPNQDYIITECCRKITCL